MIQPFPEKATPFFTVTAYFRYTLISSAADLISQFLDDVWSHLGDLGAEDTSVVLDQRDSEFSLSILVASSEGESIETVVGKGVGMMRTAFHACGAVTANWPSPTDALVSVAVKSCEVRESDGFAADDPERLTVVA